MASDPSHLRAEPIFPTTDVVRQLEAIFARAPFAAFTVAADGTVTSWNDGAERLFGWTRAEIVGSRQMPWVPAEAREELRRLHLRVLEGRPFSGLALRRVRKDGSAVDVDAATSPLAGPGGEAVGLVVIMNDVSEQRRAQAAGREQLGFLQALLDAIPVPIFYKDEQLVYRGCNVAFERFLGRRRDEIVDHPVTNVADAPHADRYTAADRALLGAGGTQTYESEVVGSNGERRDVVFSKAMLPSTSFLGGRGIVGTILDISERKRAEERLVHEALHDSLTGLPNRRLFHARLDEALARAKRSGDMVAVAFVDLDRFKLINDTLGHAAGDRLLQQVAERLQRSVRAGDTLARMGGDEFTVILPELGDAREAAKASERILELLDAPFTLSGREIVVTASVGVSLYPLDGESTEALLKRADSAMYRAKEDGKDCYRIASPEMDEAVHARLELEAELRRALRSELSLVWQPQRSLRDRRLVGFEVLLRWQHPLRGAIPPERFVPIAEESGLIVPIGRWVLESACLQLAAWSAEGLPPVRVAVNVSARQLLARGFVDEVRDVLARNGVPPGLLELELTETQVMGDVDESARRMEELGRLGVRLAIDDFGTGFSSLSRLQRLPVERLKIDRSFVADLEAERSTLPLAEGIVNLAHALGMHAVAEGVESERQAELLARLGCEEAQGWLFGRPAPVEKATELLRGAGPDGAVAPRRGGAYPP